MWNVRVFVNYAETSRDQDEICERCNRSFLEKEAAFQFACAYIKTNFIHKHTTFTRDTNGTYRACDNCSWGAVIEIKEISDKSPVIQKETKIMENNKVTMKNLVVGGWYNWVSVNGADGPFLVTYIGAHYFNCMFLESDRLLANGLNSDVDEHVRILPTNRIPDDDLLKRYCLEFNEYMEKNAKLQFRPNGTNYLGLLRQLSFDPVHPCKLVVHEMEWDEASKSMKPIKLWNQETEDAIFAWKLKCPQLPIFVCQKINNTSETMAFRCPRCGHMHTHGLTDGVRESSCEYLGTVYIVIEEK